MTVLTRPLKVLVLAMASASAMIAVTPALAQDAVFDLGAQVHLDFDADRVHLFPAG